MKQLAVRFLASMRQRLKPKFPTVRQYDRTDCGPAALLSVLRYHGGDASLAFVRQLSHTGVQGTSMWSLHEAAKTLGFRANGARALEGDLGDDSLPCIAHLVLDDGHPHFVVIYRITKRKILVGDPARGLHWTTRASFSQQWKSRALLLLSPSKRLHDTPAPHWAKWVFGYFRREETWLTQALFLGFAYASLGLLTALFVRALIDRFIPDGDVRNIVAVGVGLLILQGVRVLVGYVRSWLLIELNRRVDTRMTVDALSHLFHLPAHFFESRRTGDITSRINDSVRIHAAMLNVLGNAAIDVVVVIGSLAILFYLAPLFGWMAMASVTMLCTLVGVAAGRVRDHQFKAKQAHAGVQASYIDSIGAIDPIRGTNSASRFGTLLGGMYERTQGLLARLGIVQTRVSAVVDLIAGGVVVIALTAGSLLVVQETSTLGALMAVYSLLAGALPAAARIVESYLQLQEASVASTRLLDLMLVDPERNEGEQPFQMSAGISIRGGVFHWQGGRHLLENIQMEISRGRLTALCGPSGVGKSTLIKILDRRYRLHAGEMLVDGTDVEAIDVLSYRQHVSTLPESVSLLNGTIAENILLGRDVRDIRELLDRIASLGLTGFMTRFPSGVFTRIGDEGRQVSSGERQTIGLLRALHDLPDVLLVDEGMNAEDAEFAQVFFKALTNYANDHAVLVVSHSPRTLLRADHVYLMKGGTIAEHGSPAELLALDSEFASLISANTNTARLA